MADNMDRKKMDEDNLNKKDEDHRDYGTYREYESRSNDYGDENEEVFDQEKDPEEKRDYERYREYETLNTEEKIEDGEEVFENEIPQRDENEYMEYEARNDSREEEVGKENFHGSFGEDEDLKRPYVEYEARNRDDSSKKKEDDREIRYIVRNELQRNFKNKKTPWLGIISLVLVGAILGSLLTGFLSPMIFGNYGNERASGDPVVIRPESEMNVENAVSKKASPSVVGVLTTISRDLGGQGFFFGQPNTQYQEAIGSGVIISEDGYILTNSHVVNNGDYEGDINVVLNDGTDTKADLLWNDESLDLAVIKVDKKGLTPMELGNSDEVSVGDKAIAIGNPLAMNLQSTLTSGYISGLNRSINVEDGSLMDGLIQTDAAINGGNSGGALLNSKGQLIGINTAKANQADGIGFAIPINTAMPIVDKIVETGSFETVYLGITGIALDQYSLYYPNQEFPTDYGILVASVLKGSFADQAGVKKGDIIYSIDGVKTDSMSALKKELIKYSHGDQATIEFHDGNKVVEGSGTFMRVGEKRS